MSFGRFEEPLPVAHQYSFCSMRVLISFPNYTGSSHQTFYCFRTNACPQSFTPLVSFTHSKDATKDTPSSFMNYANTTETPKPRSKLQQLQQFGSRRLGMSLPCHLVIDARWYAPPKRPMQRCVFVLYNHVRTTPAVHHLSLEICSRQYTRILKPIP